MVVNFTALLIWFHSVVSAAILSSQNQPTNYIAYRNQIIGFSLACVSSLAGVQLLFSKRHVLGNKMMPSFQRINIQDLPIWSLSFVWGRVYSLACQSVFAHIHLGLGCVHVVNVLTPLLFTSFALTLNGFISIQLMQMRPGECRLYNICSSSFGTRASERGTWAGRSSYWNANSPISEVTCSVKVGRAAQPWQGHQFHETFPRLHLKARHNRAQGRCTMKWNGRPDLGERTQRRVHRNEGHSLPRDAIVSRKGPAGFGQTVEAARDTATC